MTIPYLMNCDHDGDGWCIRCVKELALECDLYRDEMERLDSIIAELREKLSEYQRSEWR